MALFEISNDKISKVDLTTFEKEGILERRDLQNMLKNNIGVVAPDTMVLAEEFGNWEASKKRLDLLCLDRSGCLVVVELKRDEDGGHMDLQAIRYAAMISKMTFAEAVDAYLNFSKTSQADAERAILNFLGWETPNEDNFAGDVRIILVSSNFSKEVTTTAMWLSEFDVDIACVRISPYRHEGKVLVDVQTIFPLPEAEDYQVKIRRKEQEERKIRIQNRDLTRFELTIGDKVVTNLPKRRVVYLVTAEAIRRGAKPLDVLDDTRNWLFLKGKFDSESFVRESEKERPKESSVQEAGRFYTSDEDLFYSEGQTFALTKMWGHTTLKTVDKVIAQFGLVDVQYRPV